MIKSMAPVKFGLFKARSREQEQPSTENLLHISNSSDQVAIPGSPIPSTSKGIPEDLVPADISELHLDSEDDDEVISEKLLANIVNNCGDADDEQMNYNYVPLKNQVSTDATSSSTLNLDEALDPIPFDAESIDGASTSCDANSLQFDETSLQFDEASLAASEDLSVYCGALKKPKKSRSKEEKQMRDIDMWRASNVEVMQNLLSRSGTLDEQIKWEAIATSRGLCTLTDNCTCGDCTRAKYLAGVTDGDGGLGAAPLFNAISVGCQVQ